MINVNDLSPYNKIIKPLSLAHIRNYSENMHEPLLCVKYGVIDITVYRAKREHSLNEWMSKSAYYLTLEARKSYYRYGDYPPLDKYDNKSAIYLVRCEYPATILCHTIDGKINDWLSVRFIPYGGSPKGSPDFSEVVKKQGASIETLLTKKLRALYTASTLDNTVTTISRVCSIAPYVVDDTFTLRAVLSKKLACAYLCFALANQEHFANKINLDSNLDSNLIVTGLFRSEIIKQSLTIRNTAGRRVPTFTKAKHFLGVKGNSIGLDRTNSIIFKYPSYFLNMQQMLKFLKGMIKKELLDESVIADLAGVKNFYELQEDIAFAHGHLRQVGGVLSYKGVLGTLNHTQLRELINLFVDDGPTFYMMWVKDWIEELNKVTLRYK